jgi:hypothetical protein
VEGVQEFLTPLAISIFSTTITTKLIFLAEAAL